MPRLTPTHLRAGKMLALPLAVIVSGLVIGQASSAAFSSNTDNPSNAWNTGSVEIGDDDQGAAMFHETGLEPGAAGSRCIAVTSTGSLDSTVRFFADAPTGTTLADAITMTVTQGTGGGFGDCTGFTPAAADATVFDGSLSTLASTASDFDSGLGDWTAGEGETRTFKIDWTVDEDAANDTQGESAGVDFVWEARND